MPLFSAQDYDMVGPRRSVDVTVHATQMIVLVGTCGGYASILYFRHQVLNHLNFLTPSDREVSLKFEALRPRRCEKA